MGVAHSRCKWSKRPTFTRHIEAANRFVSYTCRTPFSLASVSRTLQQRKFPCGNDWQKAEAHPVRKPTCCVVSSVAKERSQRILFSVLYASPTVLGRTLQFGASLSLWAGALCVAKRSTSGALLGWCEAYQTGSTLGCLFAGFPPRLATGLSLETNSVAAVHQVTERSRGANALVL